MARVKIKKRKPKASVEIEKNGKTVSSKTKKVKVPEALEVGEGPCSKTGVSLGYRKSRDYQSVTAQASVEVPVKTGKEQEGLLYAAEQADKFLKETEEAVDSYLRDLA